MNAIDKERIHHSGAALHFIEAHDSNVSSFGFYTIEHEHVAKPIRGGDWRRVIAAYGMIHHALCLSYLCDG